MPIVYVLTNPAMPNLVKIGRTTDDDANSRIAQLYSTGVPVPFKLEYACRVANGEDVEKALHIAFGPNRVNPRREFFRIESEQVIAILRLLHVEDATREVAAQPAGPELDEQSIAAGEQLATRRPNLNFEEMGIPVGSELKSVRDGSSVTVVGPRKVRLGDDVISLTAATRKVLQLDYSVAPGPHWTFNGKLIRDLYEETYGDVE
jgi:hypothetical protein